VVGGCVYAAIATSRRGPMRGSDELSYADLDHLHARGLITDADYDRHIDRLGAYTRDG
jgi:hypothetical protein